MSNKEIAYWEEQFNHCEQVRKPFEEQWYMNMAFYFGKQWVVWQRLGSSGARLSEPPPTKHRVRLVSNKCKRVVRNEINKFTKEEPHFYVVPSTTEPEDIAAARAGESISDYILHTSAYNAVRRRSSFWLSLCGTSYIHTYCTGVDAPIDISHIPPFHIYIPHVQEEEIEKQPYVMYCRAVPADDFAAQMGIEGLSNDVSMDGGMLEQKFFNSLGIKNNNTTKHNLMFVKEIWIKPCRNYPNGGLIVIANGKIIYKYSTADPSMQGNLFESEDGPVEIVTEEGWSETEYPLDHGMFPFAKQDHIPTGRFWAESSLVDFIPLQKEYNKTRSQMIEAKNIMLKPQVTYIKGSIDPKKVTSAPGLMIPVQPGYEAPQPFVHQLQSGIGDAELTHLQDDMQEIGGNTEMSQGKVPPGIEAASAIAYLQEENDSVISTTIASIEEATEIVGKQCLALVQQYWSPQKIVDVVSKNNAQDALVFKAARLADNTDIRVEAGSMAPKSRAARQAFITELMRGGFIPAEKGLKYLQMSETSSLYQELQIDSRQAQRENLKMAKQQQLATNDFDNNEAHVYEHELYMKSQEFELLDQLVQQLFKTHVEEHKTRIMINALPQPTAPIGPEPGSNSEPKPTGEPVGVS